MKLIDRKSVLKDEGVFSLSLSSQVMRWHRTFNRNGMYSTGNVVDSYCVKNAAQKLRMLIGVCVACAAACGVFLTASLPLSSPAYAATPSTLAQWSERNQSLDDWAQLRKMLDSSEQITWVFTGDSITHGAQTSAGLRRYSEYINNYFHTTPIRGISRANDLVINTGVSNSTTRYLKEQFQVSVLDKNADVVSIALGMNDSVNAPAAERVAIETFKANLEYFVDHIRTSGALPILQTQNYPTDGRHADFEKYEDAIRNVAIEKNAILLDINQYWDDTHTRDNSDGWMVTDGVHPSAQGYLEWAKFVLKQLDMWDETSNLARTHSAAVEKSGTAPLAPAPPEPPKQEPETLESTPKHTAILNYSIATDTSTVCMPVSKDGDAAQIAGASASNITFRFKTTDMNQTGTIVSFSDADSKAQYRIDLVNGGHIKVMRQFASGGNLDGFTTQFAVNNGRFHTVSVNAAEGMLVVSIDGEKKMNFTNNQHFKGATSLALNRFSVDRITLCSARAGEDTYENQFGGVVDYVAVADRILTDAELAAMAPQPEKDTSVYGKISTYTHNKNSNKANTWVFLGGSTGYGAIGDINAKNAIEVFDEVIRWECNGTPSCDTHRSNLRLEARSRFIVNSSFPKQTSADILANYDTRVGKYKAQVLYLMPDVLDAWGDPLETLDAYKTHVLAIVKAAQADGMAVILVSPPERESAAAPYAEAAQEIAEQEDAGFIDAYDYFKRLQQTNDAQQFAQLFTQGELNHKGQLLLGKFLLTQSGITVPAAKPIAKLNYYDPQVSVDNNPDPQPTIVVPSAQSNVQDGAAEPVSCSVAPWAKVLSVPGVQYTVTINGEAAAPSADGTYAYGYGATLKVVAVPEARYAFAEKATSEWEWTAPTREELKCYLEPQPQPQPDPGVDPEPEPNPQPQPEPDPEPQPQPDPSVDPEPEPQPQPQAEARSDQSLTSSTSENASSSSGSVVKMPNTGSTAVWAAVLAFVLLGGGGFLVSRQRRHI